MEHITNADFDKKVVNADTLVVVDFFADWCGPCKRLAPIFEELSGSMKNVSFVKVDVEAEQDLAMKYQVQSIPTILMFKGGEPVERIVGLMPRDKLEEVIASHA